MERFRLDLQNAPEAVDRRASGLFDEKGDGTRFVEQAQTPMLVALARILRIKIDAAADQDAIDVGDHGADPAHVEIPAARTFVALDQIFDIGADRRRPAARVRGVDRELAGFRRDVRLAGRHAVGLRVGIEGRDPDPCSEGEGEGDVRAENEDPGRLLVFSRL